MHSVLQDLSLAMLDTSGIPQDTRLIFRTLGRAPGVALTGLLAEMGPGLTSHLPVLDSAKAGSKSHHLALALYFAAFSGQRASAPLLGLGRLGAAADGAFNPLRRFRTMDVPADLYCDVIWRRFFEKTLAPEDRAAVLARRFAVTNLNYRTILNALRLPACLAPKLDTRGHDFFLTSEPRPVAVSPGTVKIMRYHDPIPILHADTMGHCRPIEAHFALTKRSMGAGYFVCNSHPTEQELLRLFPEARGRSTTIPCVLPDLGPHHLNGVALPDIAKTRLSTAALGAGASPERVLAAAGIRKDTRFILGLSTLEPRKNFEGLIRAWELVKLRHAPDLKLVVVGRPGWRYERILAAMRPHLVAGELIHLQDLPQDELRAIYRMATCLVFPSFAEGFGFPPVEALQCGTPPVVSDIPTHRWVCGDAALYCDPYDVESIAQRIGELAVDANAPALRAKLVRLAAPILLRYTSDRAMGRWDDLLGRLKRGERPRSEVG